MRRTAVAIAAALLAIAGCSQPGGDDRVSAQSARDFANPPVEQIAFADVTIVDGYGSSEADDGVFPRTIDHYIGQTSAETEPLRVVVLSGGQLDQVLSLGIMPVGATVGAGADVVPEYLPPVVPDLATELAAIKNVGGRSDPELEKIADLEPDLILGDSTYLREFYPQLAEIAPTVFVAGNSSHWREDYLLISAALGRQQRAEKVLDDLTARAEEVATRVADPAPVVSLVRFNDNAARAMSSNSVGGMAMDEMGMRRPRISVTDELFTEVSLEEFTKLDVDILFYGSMGKETSSESVVGPLTDRLKAVKDGNAFAVDDRSWFQNPGPLATGAIFDEFAESITEWSCCTS